MKYQEKIEKIENQIEQLRQQANAQINQLIGKKEMLKELQEEEEIIDDQTKAEE